ncbi:hypothetical protein HYW59_00935 [Candidatus Kaiserbacteria bacterium]|nr:hypothetical protein [Candidatus Kaiserbacteria bacterium]
MKKPDKNYSAAVPIADERIEEFRRIYKEAYGEEISVGNARIMALRLITLYRLLMQPLHGEGSSSPSQDSPAQSADEAS